MPVAPHIVNDVSYVTDITHESDFAWQAQYLETVNDISYVTGINDACDSFFVAGAAFGDLGVSLFVAGAVFGDLGVSFFVASAAFNLVILERHFLWQAQYSVKSG